MVRTTLINARVIDGRGEVLERAHVIVEGTRVADVLIGDWGGSADQIIDLAGETLLPGLIDAHTHLYRSAGENYMAGSGGSFSGSRGERFGERL